MHWTKTYLKNGESIPLKRGGTPEDVPTRSPSWPAICHLMLQANNICVEEYWRKQLVQIVFQYQLGSCCSLFWQRLTTPEYTSEKSAHPRCHCGWFVHWLFVEGHFIIIALLIGPLIKSTSSRTEKPIVVIAQDNSSSIPLNSDSTFYKNEYQEQLANLKSTVRRFWVETTYSVNRWNRCDRFLGWRTDFSDVFEELDNVYANQNVGAVVLASDGLYNRGRDTFTAR